MFLLCAGVLDLKNCQEYHLTIYPDSFPNTNSSSKWDDGFSTVFQYSTRKEGLPPSRKTPNSVKILKDIQSRSVIIDLEAIAEAYTCSDVFIQISTQRSIRSNETSNQIFVYNETHILSKTQTILIDQLTPCTFHRLKIWKKGENVEIYSQNFKTDLAFDGMNDTLLRLQENEVVLGSDPNTSKKNNIMTFDENSLELKWVDRCVDEYMIKLCRFPLECLQDNSRSRTSKLVEDKVIRFNEMKI